EELGDVLLQVIFHARIAAERSDGFDIDDISARLVDKLVYRHPHVFADVRAADAAAVEANWEQLKSAEKPHREHPLEGIPAGMPELARAAKVASRLERAGLGDRLRAEVDARLRQGRPGAADPANDAGADDTTPAGADTAPGVGAAGAEAFLAARLMEVVLAARAEGVDPSAALRGLLRELEMVDLTAPPT